MDPKTQRMLSACAGSAGAAGDATYVDDVFSTTLYNGTNNTKTINNGLDLDGEGGLVWLKSRSNGASHVLYDTERGDQKALSTNSASGEFDWTNYFGQTNYGLTSFNSNGFTLGLNGSGGNQAGEENVSWSFRKCEKFFDIVTYNGSSAWPFNVSHNLGCVPGAIAIKKINGSNDDWYFWHRNDGSTGKTGMGFNFTTASQNDTNNSAIGLSSTSFSPSYIRNGGGSANDGNSSSQYVAYLFAHDEAAFGENSDESIIKCGRYFGTNNDGNYQELGWEPQWVLVKNIARSENWSIFDNTRGVHFSGVGVNRNDVALHPNNANIDQPIGNVIAFNPTGFTLNSGSGLTNWQSGELFVYIAIRRSHKPPTAGTEVYDHDVNADNPTFNFPPDIWFMTIDNTSNGGTSYPWTSARLLGGRYLSLGDSRAANNESSFSSPSMDGEPNSYGDGWQGTLYRAYAFARRAKCVDVVTYFGNSSNRTINHNLEVAPELMIIKNLDQATSWRVYSSVTGANKYLQADTTDGEQSDSPGYMWNSTSPTSSVFNLGISNTLNGTGNGYVAFLFASLAGVSKVGTYSSTNNDITIDCGFTAGARFVLIKRTDSTGDWYLFNTQNGIVAGNDYYTSFNAGNGSNDWIDPDNSGFTIPSGSGVNINGGTYLFLAFS